MEHYDMKPEVNSPIPLEQPLFTIGIASYNYANYIKRALEAIKNQTFKDYEILVSDDCSTDHSVEVVKEFINENPDINVRLLVKSTNEGLVSNKNTLIKNAQGQYLMLCDADDWMAEDCLANFSDIINLEQPDRVICQVAHIDENGKEVQVETIPEFQTKWGWNIHHGSAYKTDILKKHDILIQKMPDDVYFTLDFAKYCKKTSIINQTLYYWFVHTDSEGRKHRNYTSEYVSEIFGGCLEYISEIMKNENSNDYQELALVRLKLYYFYVLFVFQNETLKDKYKYYDLLHHKMLDLDSNYKTCRYLSKTAPAILREYPMKAIRLCAKLEKYHLMKLGLLGYHVIARFKYFDQ